MNRLFSTLCIFFSIIFVVIAGRNLWSYQAGTNIVQVARLIERGHVVPERMLGSLDISENYKSAMTSCLDDLTRAGTTIRMARVDAAIAAQQETNAPSARASASPLQGDDQGGAPSTTELISRLSQRNMLARSPAQPADQQELALRARLALEAISTRISCAPTDGNAWLSRAIALDLLGGAHPDILTALQVSYAMSPSEKWIIAKRLRFVLPKIGTAFSTLAPEFSADTWRYVSHASARDIAEFYLMGDTHARALVALQVRRLEERRKKDVIAQIDRLGVSVRFD